MKKKMFCDIPELYQNALKERVVDFYSNRYDSDSVEIRHILKGLENKTVEEIERGLER